MNTNNEEQTPPQHLDNQQVEQLNQRIDEAFELINAFRNPGAEVEQRDRLRWIRALDPRPLWQSLVEKIYRDGQYHLKNWIINDFLSKVARTIQVWYPSTMQDAVTRALSRGAVVAIVMSNPTASNIALYLFHICCDFSVCVQDMLLILGKMIVYASEKMSALTQLIERLIRMLTQGLTSGPEVNEHEPTSIVSFGEIQQYILAMIAAVAATVKGSCMSTIMMTLQSGMKSMASVARGGKAIEYLFSKAKSFAHILVSCIYPDKDLIKLTSHLASHDLSLDGESTDVVTFLEALHDRGSTAGCKKMKGDITFLRNSKQLLDDLKLMIFDMPYDVKELIIEDIKLLEKVVLEATAQINVGVRKYEPFHFCIGGEPGLGKSVAVNILISMMVKNLSKKPKFAFPLNELFHSFSWTFGEKFVNGYRGQYIVYMDDICKEAKADGTNSPGMLINTVSNVSMNVGGAAIEDKVNPFISRLIMSTTNDLYPSAQSLALKNATAFWRRRHMLVKMVTSTRLDPDLGTYVAFQILDPLDPKIPGGVVLSFQDLAQLLMRNFEKHFDHEMRMGNLDEWAERVMESAQQLYPDDTHEGTSLEFPHNPLFSRDKITFAEYARDDRFNHLVSKDAPRVLLVLSDGTFKSLSYHDTGFPRELNALSMIIKRQLWHFISSTCMLVIEPQSYYSIKKFYGQYGWKLDDAKLYLKSHGLHYIAQPAEVINQKLIKEWKEGEGVVLDPVGLDPDYDIRMFSWTDICGVFRSYDTHWEQVNLMHEPTALISPGFKFRVRLENWIRSVKIWAGVLGIVSVVASVAIIARYMKRDQPTYSATNLYSHNGTLHEEISPFSVKHRRNVHTLVLPTTSATCFMYDKRSILSTRHVFAKIQEGDSINLVVNGRNHGETFTFDNYEVLAQGSDLCVYHFQNEQIPLAPNARSSFSDRIHSDKLDVEVLTAFSYGKHVARPSEAWSYVTSTGEKIVHRQGLYVTGKLGKGNSGSIMVVPGRNKIIGVQVSQNQLNTNFEFVTQDYLPPARDSNGSGGTHWACGKELSQGLKEIHGVDFVPQSQSSKTKIKPSLISSFMTVLYSTIFQPAVLHKSDKRLLEPVGDLLEKSMSGYDHDFVGLDNRLTTQIAHEFAMEDNVIRGGERRLLTLSEMVNGQPELNIKPFEISTAPGLPWCHTAKLKGKRDHIYGDLPNREISEDLKRALDSFNFEGDITGYACLKDELRTEDKIKIGKTRSFIVLPMDYNLQLRKYFGAYIGVQHKLAGSISSCVGVNPYTQWEDLYARLARCSDEWEDFDYSDWDRTLSPDWFETYAIRVSLWYNDGEDNAKKRLNLMRQLAFAQVQVGNKLYRTGGGNKSGCAITAEINTDIQEMMMYYCWLQLAKIHKPEFATFHHFRMCNEFLLYGDDQVKATRMADWFNGNNLLPLMTDLGMKITPADKGSTVFAKKAPRDVQFLKRNFTDRVGPGLMKCPLQQTSIIKMIHFIHKSSDDHYSTKMNIDCALKEMYFHGKTTYDSFRDELVKACLDVNLESVPNWKSWELYDDEWKQGVMEPPTYW